MTSLYCSLCEAILPKQNPCTDRLLQCVNSDLDASTRRPGQPWNVMWRSCAKHVGLTRQQPLRLALHETLPIRGLTDFLLGQAKPFLSCRAKCVKQGDRT